MKFMYPYVLLLLFILPIIWIFIKDEKDDLRRYFSDELYKKMVVKGGGLSKRVRKILYLLSLAFVILALSRPYLDNGEIKVKKRVSNLIVAFDISRSMLANDVYPNRFELAKRKFSYLLDFLKDVRVGVVAFSSRAFLVAPLSEDYDSLKYLVNHMRLDFISLKGTNFMAPLEVANSILKNSSQKALLIFTDGGDQSNFSKEIAYAKTHNIKVFIYAIGTQKGGIMETKNGVVRDKDGNVAVVRLNPLVKKLSDATGGFYMKFSFSKDDMKSLANIIKSKLSSKSKDEVVKKRLELFEVPLIAAIILFLATFSSLPRRGNK